MPRNASFPLLATLLAAATLSSAPRAQDPLTEMEQAFAEGSFRRALELCRDGADHLAGDARGRAIALWALAAERQGEQEELRALYEREIDRVPFPHSATLAQAEGRVRSHHWAGWEKLAPLERALSIWEAGGEPHRGSWCDAAFDLIEGLSISWQHDIPVIEWEKVPQPEDPEERRLAWEAWRRARGLAEDRRRWVRTETLFAGILELAPDAERRARALLERGMRRLVAQGDLPGIDPLRTPGVAALIDRLRAAEGGAPTADAIARWQDGAEQSIADWRALVAQLPHDSLADDAAFLVAWATEERLGDLVLAEQEYRTLLRAYPESQWTTDALSRAERILREGLALLEPPRIVPSGTAPSLEVEARNVAELTLSTWPVPDYLDRVEEEIGLVPEPSRLAGGPPAATWKVPTGCAEDHKGKRVAIELPFDRPGAYRVRIEGGASAIEVPVFVSGLALQVEGGSDEAIAWLTSGSDGRPVEGGEVLLRLDIRRRDERRSFSTRAATDAMGIVRWPYPERFLPLLEAGWHFERLAAVAALGGEVSPAPGFGPRFDTGRRPRDHYYAETDRPAYRPGQNVRYKVTLRRWDGERYGLPAPGTELTLRYLDAQESPLHERTTRLDADGAIAGEFALPAEGTLGMCSLHVAAAGGEVPPRNWDRSVFRVEEYRRPDFEVAIDAPPEPVLYGDPLAVTVRGSFLSGEPVRGGQVRIRVQRSPYRFSYRPPSPFPWSAPHPDEEYWGGEDVFSGEAQLDGEGIAEFAIPTAAPGDDLDSRFRVEAWLTDASGREERAAASIPVTRTAYFAHLEPARHLIAPGEPIEAMVRVMDASERGASAAGEVEIARRVDREVMKDGALTPVTDWEPLRAVPLRVEAGGSLFREVATEEGELRLTFRSRDARGKEFEGSCRVWVVGAGFTGRDYSLDGLSLVTSTPIARIGDEARIAVLTERPDATILVLRSAAGRVLGVDVVRAQGQVAQLRFPVGDAEAPNFFVDVLAVWDGELHRAQAEVTVPPDPYFLSGTLTASAEELLPGADVDLALTLVDREGRPVAGSWSVTLFDRALLAIQPEIAVSPMQHFHERRWMDTMRAATSLGWRSRGSFAWFPGAEPVGRRDHPLPDLLRHSWQRRFEFVAEDLFAAGGAELGETIAAWGGNDDGGSGNNLRGGDRFSGAAGAPGLEMEAASAPQGAARESKRLLALGDADSSEEAGGAAEELAAVTIRQNFAETAAWEPNLRTDVSGRGTLRVRMPDALTAWRGIARGVDATGRAFEARVEVRTQRNIRLRLATPRFLREGDEAVLSLVASNQFDEAVSGRATLVFPGAHLAFRGEAAPARLLEDGRAELSFAIEIPARGERTIDLPFATASPGIARLTATLATPRESDGLEMPLPVLPYGLDRFLGAAGIAEDADGFSSDGWTFAIPEESDPASRTLVVDLTPSPAIALIESLPYLVQYPYGCVEQTLNRFIPAAMVAETLERTGVDLAEILPERPAGIPVGFWGHVEARPLEILRREDLAHLLSIGMAKLRRAQNGDGSFGWWHGYDGDPYITALVVEHLCTARDAGIIEVDLEVIDGGARWLATHALGRDLAGELEIYEQSGLEELVWVARALMHVVRLGRLPLDDDAQSLLPLVEFLHRARDRLGAQGKALLALALNDTGRPADAERARVLIRNLYDDQGGQERFGTVHFGREGALAWYDHGVESTAWALRALIAIVPDDPRIPQVVRWLLENRAGSHYDSTRSTAAVALALTDHLRNTRELDCDLQAEVLVDGTSVGSFAVDRSTLFTKRGRIAVPAALLESGEHRLEVRRGGRGPLHWSASLQFYSREDPVPAGGNRVEVVRRAYRLVDVKRPRKQEEVIDGKAVIRTYEVWERDREPLDDGAVLAAGDRVLVELEVTSANDFRYVVIESPKPAGFETVTAQSGFVGGIYGYRELRDEKVVWFASSLPEGPSRVEIELRAERPGRYRALPATVEAMYLPHVRANSTSGGLGVR